MAVRVYSGVTIGPAGQKIYELINRYPKPEEIYVTSAYRDGDPGYHGGYDGGAALDIGFFDGVSYSEGARRGRDFAKWCEDSFYTEIAELIHTTPYNDDDGFYVKNGQKLSAYGYGEPTNSQHADHVHLAMYPNRVANAMTWVPISGGAPPPAPTPPPVSTGDCFGWDASNHDWGRGPMDVRAAANDGIKFMTHKALEGTNQWYVDAHYQEAMDRARGAGMPIQGVYHVLHGVNGAPGAGSPQVQAEQLFDLVNQKTPYWKDIPWIWQCDAEKFDYMDRAPDVYEINAFMDMLHYLSGGYGYFTVYAPKWLYGNNLQGLKYDLWQSDYRGSGAARPYRQQWADVERAIQSGGNSGFSAYSGKEPLILQFASDATIGSQPICDINKFRGSFEDLHRMATHGKPVPAPPPAPTPEPPPIPMPEPIPPVPVPDLTQVQAAIQDLQTRIQSVESLGLASYLQDLKNRISELEDLARKLKEL